MPKRRAAHFKAHVSAVKVHDPPLVGKDNLPLPPKTKLKLVTFTITTAVDGETADFIVSLPTTAKQALKHFTDFAIGHFIHPDDEPIIGAAIKEQLLELLRARKTKLAELTAAQVPIETKQPVAAAPKDQITDKKVPVEESVPASESAQVAAQVTSPVEKVIEESKPAAVVTAWGDENKNKKNNNADDIVSSSMPSTVPAKIDTLSFLIRMDSDAAPLHVPVKASVRTIRALLMSFLKTHGIGGDDTEQDDSNDDAFTATIARISKCVDLYTDTLVHPSKAEPLGVARITVDGAQFVDLPIYPHLPAYQQALAFCDNQKIEHGEGLVRLTSFVERQMQAFAYAQETKAVETPQEKWATPVKNTQPSAIVVPVDPVTTSQEGAAGIPVTSALSPAVKATIVISNDDSIVEEDQQTPKPLAIDIPELNSVPACFDSIPLTTTSGMSSTTSSTSSFDLRSPSGVRGLLFHRSPQSSIDSTSSKSKSISEQPKLDDVQPLQRSLGLRRASSQNGSHIPILDYHSFFAHNVHTPRENISHIRNDSCSPRTPDGGKSHIPIRAVNKGSTPTSTSKLAPLAEAAPNTHHHESTVRKHSRKELDHAFAELVDEWAHTKQALLGNHLERKRTELLRLQEKHSMKQQQQQQPEQEQHVNNSNDLVLEDVDSEQPHTEEHTERPASPSLKSLSGRHDLTGNADDDDSLLNVSEDGLAAEMFALMQEEESFEVVYA